MAKKFKDLASACWKGYKAVGLKDKNGKKVPNCVPEETQIQEADEVQSSDYKLSASGRKVRAKHIIFHNQDDDKKEDNKEDMKEETLVEATVETKKYSWGTMKTVHHGADFSIPLHPEHHQAIAKLKDQQEHHFKDETGRHWTARRKGDEVHFQGANGGNSTKVKHDTMKESYDDNRRGFGKRPREDDEYHVPDPEVKKNKLKKEEKMTDDEMAERERIVKGMKKNLQSFKDKYGERAKSVMYATATKLAKEEVESVDEAVIYHGGDPFEQPSAATIARRERAAEKRKQKEAEQKRQKEQLNKEEVEQIDEANHREFASQGKMHPDMAKHMTVGSHMDYYEPKTGDKVHGKVIKNDGKEVHVKQSHDSYDSKKVGSMHKFKVSSKLDEAKNDVPFDGPYTKKPSDVKDKSGATHTPMSRVRDLARQAMKKQMKEEFGIDIDDQTADGLVEAAQKVDIPAYLRKAKGEAPLTLKDLKRKDTISDRENLAKLRNEEHNELEKGNLETTVKSYKEFMTGLDEALWPGTPEHNAKFGGPKRDKGSTTSTTHGTAIGTGTGVRHVRDYDRKEKESAETPEHEKKEKRGRGRPAGSSSGARLKNAPKSSDSGSADYTGYKLHLPNTNK
jgi:hypothetical protein